MRVLAVDTTSAHGSVALVEGVDVAAEVRVKAPEGHSRWLLEAVSMLLRTFSWRLADIGGLAVTVGPGSFTGLRVGMATVQGLALGASRPVVGLSTLEVLASLGAREEAPVVAMVDAWRGEVYAEVFADGRSLGPPVVGRPEALAAGLPERCVLVGDGARRHQDTLKALRPQARALGHDGFLALPLARLAGRVLERGGGKDARALAPLYVRGADIRPPQA
jgi:tRNA threonylcarbamoyladenosine biosynthesis protein TsaB